MMRLGIIPKVHRTHRQVYARSLPVSGSILNSKASYHPIIRPFTSSTRIWQRKLPADQKAGAQTLPRADPFENVEPETVQKPSNAEPKTDALLSEQTVSNREQRRADWAIMKEMSRYLWPKVYPRVQSVLAEAPDSVYRMI